jgi:translation elongation factor EF-Tu-like GTPase
MFRMTVSDIFFIRGRGLVATGRVEEGVLQVGDEVYIGDRGPLRVDGIEAFRKILDRAEAGENIGVLFKGLEKGDIEPGAVMTTGAGSSGPTVFPDVGL